MADSIHIITLLNDGNFDGVFDGIEAVPFAAIISGMDDEAVLNNMRSRRSAVRQEIRAGTGVTVRNYTLCLTDSLERLPALAALFDKIANRFPSSYMDIIVWADSEKKVAEAVENLTASADGVFGLSVFYTDNEELLLEDVRSVCANIIENKIENPAFPESGFYLMRASAGSMGDFQLFYELSARRLEEAEKKGRLELNAADMRDFTRKIVEGSFKKINMTAFRYIIWNKNFKDKFEEAGYYRDKDPFAENVKRFITLNCTGSFYKYIEDLHRIDGQFYRLFFERFTEDFGELIGNSRIEIMGASLALLRQIKSEIEQEKKGVSFDGGSKPSDSDKEDLWAYSDYMYKNYFTRRMEYERLSCELEFVDAFYSEIDKAAINERKNLTEFNKMINEKRGKRGGGNRFAQKIYDKINELFKCNSEAENYLLKCIKEYLNSLAVSGKDSSARMALFAPTAEKFRVAMENEVNVIFINDLPEGIKDNLDGFARSILPPPVLLTGACSFDHARQGLDLNAPAVVSFKPFGGYENNAAQVLDNDENMVALYEYYKVNTRDSGVITMLAKII